MIHWRDGRFSDGEVRLNLDGEAFRFGAGLFETLYFNGRELCHLGIHLERLHGSLEQLAMRHIRLAPAHLAATITDLIEQNGLAGTPARINIYCFPDGDPSAPCSVLVTARPHDTKPDQTFRLALWPDHHLTPLARHKSMNYWFHMGALNQAKAAGYDGALLMDHTGNLLETTTAAIAFLDGDKLITPASEPKLPSTALKVACQVFDVEPRPIHLDELSGFTHAYALNSLMGMRPVTTVDRMEFTPDEDRCATATKAILCTD